MVEELEDVLCILPLSVWIFPAEESFTVALAFGWTLPQAETSALEKACVEVEGLFTNPPGKVHDTEGPGNDPSSEDEGPTTGPPSEGPTTGPPSEGPTTGPPGEGPTTGPPGEGPTTGPPGKGPTTLLLSYIIQPFPTEKSNRLS